MSDEAEKKAPVMTEEQWAKFLDARAERVAAGMLCDALAKGMHEDFPVVRLDDEQMDDVVRLLKRWRSRYEEANRVAVEMFQRHGPLRSVPNGI